MHTKIVNFLKSNVEPNFFKKKMFYTKDYDYLSQEILDEIIIIVFAISFLEYGESYENTKKYLLEHQIFPFLETLCGNLICIGYGQDNEYLIYYFDIEFGVFPLNEHYNDFCAKLYQAEFDWLN